MKLAENSKFDIDSFYLELQKQFPRSEMKEKAVWAKILTLPEYKIFNIFNDENKICGYFTFLELPDKTILIDYFAIFKEFHSLGYGSKAFEYLKSLNKYAGCYLEVEKENPKDINTFRRINFYKKLGAKLLDINYIYPNVNGGLPMDLYFMPFKQNYLPDKNKSLANIKFAFHKMHFDILKIAEIFSKISGQ